MFNPIDIKRRFVQSQIQKSFDNDIEKARKAGDVHPNGKWVWTEYQPGKFDWRGIKKNQKSGSITAQPSQSSAKPSPRDKIAQNNGFKDYAEMKGFQEYVTIKSLLKKPSMQAKTKQAEREALEKQVADYEKNHADVIAARNGGKKADTGSITLKITTNGSGVVKLSDSVNAKWEDVKDEDFGGRIIGIKIDGELGAKTFPYSFDYMKRKKYDLYTFEEAKAEAEKYLNNKKSELTKHA